VCFQPNRICPFTGRPQICERMRDRASARPPLIRRACAAARIRVGTRAASACHGRSAGGGARQRSQPVILMSPKMRRASALEMPPFASSSTRRRRSEGGRFVLPAVSATAGQLLVHHAVPSPSRLRGLRDPGGEWRLQVGQEGAVLLRHAAAVQAARAAAISSRTSPSATPPRECPRLALVPSAGLRLIRILRTKHDVSCNRPLSAQAAE
jgi:hypothetical protein